MKSFLLANVPLSVVHFICFWCSGDSSDSLESPWPMHLAHLAAESSGGC